MKLRRPARTVLEVCVAKRGVHRGALAAANVAQWALTIDALGRIPTIVEYAEWWSCSERTGWRHAERIEAVFGEDWRPMVEAIAVAARKHVDGRLSVAGVKATPVPASVLGATA